MSAFSLFVLRKMLKQGRALVQNQREHLRTGLTLILASGRKHFSEKLFLCAFELLRSALVFITGLLLLLDFDKKINSARTGDLSIVVFLSTRPRVHSTRRSNDSAWRSRRTGSVSLVRTDTPRRTWCSPRRGSSGIVDEGARCQVGISLAASKA